MVGQFIDMMVPESFRTVHQAQREDCFPDSAGRRAMGAVVGLSGRRRDGVVTSILPSVRAGQHVHHVETTRIRKDGTVIPTV